MPPGASAFFVPPTFNASLCFNYKIDFFYLFFRQSVKDVLEMCKMGMISPDISETLKLDDVNEALEHFSTNKSSGKILLKVAD